MKKLDSDDLFLIFALVLTLVTMFATFTYTRNVYKQYDNVKITVVK